MSNLCVKLNVMLAIAATILGGMLIIREAPREHATTAQPAIASAQAQSTAATAADPSVAMDARLAAIDARLAAMERALAVMPAAAPTSAVIAPIDPQAAAAADRRVASMFPDARFDHAELIRFRAALGELPADQQVALAAAFSRAVNSDRLQSRM
jgi:hypothetical protein